MEQKFGSSMAHLFVIKSKFQVCSWGASWPVSTPHTPLILVRHDHGSSGFQDAERMFPLTHCPLPATI